MKICRLAGVPNNYYRLLRVLEIVQRTGRRMADLDIDEVRMCWHRWVISLSESCDYPSLERSTNCSMIPAPLP